MPTKSQLLEKIDEIQLQIEKLEDELMELYKELDNIEEEEKLKTNDYVKVYCPNCGGKGTMRNESGKLEMCYFCNGKGYAVLKLWR